MANSISPRQAQRTDWIDQPPMVIASKNDAVPWSASISQGPTQSMHMALCPCWHYEDARGTLIVRALRASMKRSSLGGWLTGVQCCTLVLASRSCIGTDSHARSRVISGLYTLSS